MKTFIIVLSIIAAALAFWVPFKVFSGRKTGALQGMRAKISAIAFSAACLALCAALTCGTTYAWFTSNVTNSSAHSSADFFVTAELNSSPLTVLGSTATYQTTLSANTYTLTLTASGNASTGYAVITFDATTIYTQQLSASGGESMTLTLTINQAADMTITPCWGTYSGTVYNNGATFVYDI